jgi:DNA-binding transcriptional LysR family regulator
MDIRALTSFVAVAEHLSFARAAERLDTIQSAVSQRIKLLEQEVGAQLDRSRHHVRLTEAGRLFLVEVRRTLSQAREAVRVARGAASGQLGRLKWKPHSLPRLPKAICSPNTSRLLSSSVNTAALEKRAGCP